MCYFAGLPFEVYTRLNMMSYFRDTRGSKLLIVLPGYACMMY